MPRTNQRPLLTPHAPKVCDKPGSPYYVRPDGSRDTEALRKRYEHPCGTCQSCSHGPAITLPVYLTAVATLRTHTQTLARLIADTLTTQYPTAAYLVMDEDPGSDAMELLSILDDHGHTLHTLDQDPEPLPALPPGSPLADAWAPLDPTSPTTLRDVINTLHRTGFLFDWTPDDDDLIDTVPVDHKCLLLSTTARPQWWEYPASVTPGRVLRPYAGQQQTPGPDRDNRP
ncbi:hypothetical protein OG612_45635 (plasmid) [Streptomyces sp. NBC_01527]|uniref:hypothetical protein n=1 Tax=Streptomyces sp. NBC_01527 TaxID=2903894 RepID=UPI002F913E5D